MTKETQSFEEMMQELEQIVQKLDNETSIFRGVIRFIPTNGITISSL